MLPFCDIRSIIPINNEKVYEPTVYTLFYALFIPLFIVSIMIVLERRAIAEDKTWYAGNQT